MKRFLLLTLVLLFLSGCSAESPAASAPISPETPPAEAAQQYTAETGQLLQNESRPYLSLMLRDERAY